MPLRTYRRVCIMAALAVGCLLAAMPRVQAAQDQCPAVPRDAGHPPVSTTPITLRVVQSAGEPVPATDGLIHLAYAAQVTNTLTDPVDVQEVVPVDPLARFTPTGRNLVVDDLGRDITGKIRLFDTSLTDGLDEGESEPGTWTRVPAGGSGLMLFDVTYTDPAAIPRLLSHAITLTVSGDSVSMPTNSVPVSRRAPVILHPPLVGDGWWNGNGCCTIAGPHRNAILPINGELQAAQQFAIDYERIGPDGKCCDGPPQALSSWRFFGAPILAAAPGVVVDVVDGLPDQEPVGTIANVTAATAGGNSIIEDIGGGRYIVYGHIKSGTIPA